MNTLTRRIRTLLTLAFIAPSIGAKCEMVAIGRDRDATVIAIDAGPRSDAGSPAFDAGMDAGATVADAGADAGPDTDSGPVDPCTPTFEFVSGVVYDLSTSGVEAPAPDPCGAADQRKVVGHLILTESRLLSVTLTGTSPTSLALSSSCGAPAILCEGAGAEHMTTLTVRNLAAGSYLIIAGQRDEGEMTLSGTLDDPLPSP